MATHSSILAWRILGMGEPDGLLSMGSHRVGHDWSDLAAAAAAAAEFTPSQGLGNHTELLCWKRPWCWERLRQEEKGTTEDEMVGWHHRLNGHEFEQTPGDSEGHGSLLCCSPWGEKELDTTEWLNKQWQNSILAWRIHGQRRLVGYRPWGRRVRHDWATFTFKACQVIHIETFSVGPEMLVFLSPLIGFTSQLG